MTAANQELLNTPVAPSTPSISPFENAVTVYDMAGSGQNDKTISSLNKKRAFLAHYALVAHYNNPENFNAKYPNIIDTTEKQQVMETVARKFVEMTTGATTNGAIYWQEADPSSYLGIHDAVYTASFIRQSNHANEDTKYTQEMAILVHELTHSTADDGTTITAFQVADEPRRVHFNVLDHFGMHVIKISKNEQGTAATMNGEFFEEAFAEETAARWREQFPLSTTTASQKQWLHDKTGLPVRFFNYGYSSEGKPPTWTMNSSAYPAHTLSLLSEKSGIDLYDLLCQSRQPEHEAEAKRAFILAINRVEPGLYQKLRELQYTNEDFLKGLTYVRTITDTSETTAR